MFPIIVTSLDSTDNKHGIQRQVRHCRRRRNFIYYIEYFRKAQVFYYLVSDAKIFDIIYQLSPLLECDPDGLSPLEKLGHTRAISRVTLLFSARQTIGSQSNKGDNCIMFVSDLRQVDCCLWVLHQ